MENKPFTSLILFSLLFVSALSFAEKISESAIMEAKRLRDLALKSSIGYEIIESLTTEVGARLGGSAADALAVKWAKNKFESLGFDKVWTEPVVFPAWQRISESAEILKPFPQPLKITALGFSVATPKDGLIAEVVEFASIEELEKAALGSLAGKIAFIQRKMEIHRDGRGYSVAVRARSAGASIAASKGAVGLLIRSIGTDNDRMPHTGMMRYKLGINKIPAAALSNPDADLLHRQMSRNFPVTVRFNIQTKQIPSYTSANVIAEITGSKYPSQVVALGAHLDSWDLGTGAIDDASGVGIVTAAAHLIGQMKQRPKRSIRVVLFANEETGLWGGKAYNAAHLKQIKQHIVAAESDFGAGKIYRIDASVKPESWGIIQQIALLLKPLGIELGENKGSAGPDFSPIQASGVAAIDLKQDGSQYFDWHHTANDTLDKVDAEDIAQNVAAYVVMAYLVAQMDGDLGSELKLKSTP